MNGPRVFCTCRQRALNETGAACRCRQRALNGTGAACRSRRRALNGPRAGTVCMPRGLTGARDPPKMSCPPPPPNKKTNDTLTAKDPKQQIWGISGGLLSGGLESGGLASRTTDFGSGAVHAWGSRVWGSSVPSHRFRIWCRTCLGV